MNAFGMGLLVLILATFRVSPGVEGDPIRVPRVDGSSVSLDGVFTPEEWDGALRVSEDGNVHGADGIYLRRDGDWIYIAVPGSSQELPVLDLFLNPQGETVYQLHLSSYLAERILPGSDSVETWLDTELSLDWTANTVTWDTSVRDSLAALGIYGQRMLREAIQPMDGFEIRIRASQFDSSFWALKVRVSVFGQGDSATFLSPLSESNPMDDWLILDVGNTAPGG